MTKILASLQNLSYRYRTVDSWAIQDFNFDLVSGELYLIRGSNGSGKTTLLKLLAGIIPSYYGGDVSGKISFCEDTLEKIGIALHGIENSFIHSTPYQEVAFIIESKHPNSDVEAATNEIIKKFELQSFAQDNIDDLSSGQRQLLNVALAFAHQPRLILLDEPFAHLDGPKIEIVKRNIENQADTDDCAIVIIDHEIRAWNKKTSEIFMDVKNPTPSPMNLPEKQMTNSAILLEARSISFSYGHDAIITDFSSIFRSGECVAIQGAVGTGKTTLLKLLRQLKKPQRGEVVASSNVKLQLLIRPVLQNFFSRKIGEELGKGLEHAICFFDTKYYSDRYVFDVSQGELSKIAMEMLFQNQNDVVFLDEPFLFLDSNSRQLLMYKLTELRNQGACIVYSTHGEKCDLDIADRTIQL